MSELISLMISTSCRPAASHRRRREEPDQIQTDPLLSNSRRHQRPHRKRRGNQRIVFFDQVLRIHPASVSPLCSQDPVGHRRTRFYPQRSKRLRAGGGVIEGQPTRPALISLTHKPGHCHVAMMSRQPAPRLEHVCVPSRPSDRR